MNERSIFPKDDSPEFLHLCTRPSPLPPEGVELGVLEVCNLRGPKREVFPEQETYFCTATWGVSGQHSLYLNGTRHALRAGDFLVLEQGGPLRVEADEEDNQAFYMLLDGPMSVGISQQTGLWSGRFPYTRSPINWLEQMAGLIHNLKTQTSLASMACSLLANVAEDAKNHAPDRMVWDACSFLQKNWNKPDVNAETVLAHLSVSRSTLSPRFKKITGQPILDYLMDIRYRNALNMLCYEYASVAEIARRCGFPDASRFSTWFRKRNGKTPREVKQRAAPAHHEA